MTRTKWTMHGAVAAIALALAGCSGSDGSQGPQGPQGLQGPPGPQIVETTEACRGCHGQFAQKHTLAEYDAVHVTMDPVAPVTISGGNIVMKFNVKVNGENRDDFVWKAAFSASRVHVEDIWWVWDVTTLAGARKKLDNTALTDRTGMWSFAGAGNGNYVATLDAAGLGTVARWDGSVANPTDPGTGFMVSIKNAAGSVATAVAWLGGRPNDLVPNQACVNCHGDHVWREAVEPSGADHYQVLRPQGVEACLFCHNRWGNERTGDPRLARNGALGLMSFVHGIHNSKNLPGEKYNAYWDANVINTISVGFPAFMNNCATCHFGNDAFNADRLAKVANQPVSYDLCFSCHGGTKFTTKSPGGHANFTKASTGCAGCHDGTTAFATAGAAHNGLKTERGGVIWAGADQSVLQGKRVAMAIDSVAFEPGTPGTLVVTWSATVDGAAVNPCNATPTSAAPVFIGATASAANGRSASNMSILKAYGQGDDWVNGIPGVTSPGQPTNVSLNTTNTTCSGNVATSRVAADGATTAASTRAAVSLQGKPQLAFDPAVGTSTAVIQVRAKSPVREFVPATGALPAATRRQIVSIDKCNACHLGSMYQHGGNRVDSIELCVMCHNPASSEQQNRAGIGVVAAEAYDGKPGQTYDMRTMVHAIHAAGETGNPLVYYRNMGIYFFGTKAALAASSWPTTGGITCNGSEGPQTYFKVAGSSATGKVPVAGGSCTGPTDSTDGTWKPHNFIEVHYPQALNSCGACHVNGTERALPDPKKAVAVTVDIGGTNASNLVDDVLKGPTAATCMSCHQYGSATTKYYLNKHAYDNGWWPSAFPNGRQTLIDAAP